MWFWTLIVISFFYFFAVLQNSFFIHFNLFGAVPNLIFIFFFLLVFFEQRNKSPRIVFFAITAGLLLDIFSTAYFGVSIILLIAIGLLVKKIQSLLKEAQDKYPIVYFTPLFLASLIVYDLLRFPFNFGFIFFARILYSLFIALFGFYIFKKFIFFTI